ncbi:hypothetical protein [Pseudodonghicola sp.]|uniref:hypothetical protein n=1 Tax=Pseudodonghicola sp. TaxID=1969463 RepID=UPI003A9856C8
MRSMIVNIFEMLVAVFVVVGVIGVIATGIAMMSNPYGGGGAASLLYIIGGLVSIVMAAGVIYVLLDIRDNTRRTANAVEALMKKAE